MCHSISKFSSILGVRVTSRIIRENLSNRFLLFNIPVDLPLAEIAREIDESNNLHTPELRRFMKKYSKNETSDLLITLLGTFLSPEIKSWFSVQWIHQFIDRLLQCLTTVQMASNLSGYVPLVLLIMVGIAQTQSLVSIVERSTEPTAINALSVSKRLSY